MRKRVLVLGVVVACAAAALLAAHLLLSGSKADPARPYSGTLKPGERFDLGSGASVTVPPRWTGHWTEPTRPLTASVGGVAEPRVVREVTLSPQQESEGAQVTVLAYATRQDLALQLALLEEILTQGSTASPSRRTLSQVDTQKGRATVVVRWAWRPGEDEVSYPSEALIFVEGGAPIEVIAIFERDSALIDRATTEEEIARSLLHFIKAGM